MQTRRAFIERYAPLWAERAAARRRSGTAPDLLVADVLDGIVAGMHAELATLPADPVLAAPAATIEDAITWASPVFAVGGRFDPFAGTRRDRMLASAEVCERLSEHASARAFRALAMSDGAEPPPDEPAAGDHAPAPGKRAPRTGAWTGPAMPPPAPAPFSAGPQLGLFA